MKEYYFISYMWMEKPKPQSILHGSRPNPQAVMGGEGWGVIDVHPFQWCKEMIDSRGLIINIRNYFPVSHKEYELSKQCMNTEDEGVN